MKLILILSLLAATLIAPSTILGVERMESDSYKIRWPNLNMTSGSKSSANYNILDTIGQTAPGEYDSAGFKVKAGFPYIKTIIPFSFTISDLSIDFGTVTPGTFPNPPLTNTLTVSSGGAGGYAVTAQEDHPLKLQTSATTIADTTCNSGTCSETTSGIWDDVTKYGFGYNMAGDDVPTGAGHFVDGTYFKQFSDTSLSEAPQIVMSSNNVGTNRIATVTYQLNVSPLQTAGDYENSITYVATPTY